MCVIATSSIAVVPRGRKIEADTGPTIVAAINSVSTIMADFTFVRTVVIVVNSAISTISAICAICAISTMSAIYATAALDLCTPLSTILDMAVCREKDLPFARRT